MGTTLAKNLATEFLRLLEEGWAPDIDEFLSRIPEQHREHCRRRIEELAVLNGVTIAVGLSKSEPSSLDAETGPQLLSREEAMTMFAKMESAVAESRLSG